MTQVRHINRGDIREGGCPLCKPRHKRDDGTKPSLDLFEEGLADYEDELEEGDEEDYPY